MPETLGAEYGPLAGRTPEEALKLTMNYATDLENQLDTINAGDKPPADKPDTMKVVRGMNVASKEPITTEFIGNRSAAKAGARVKLIGQDPSFDLYDAHIEVVMSNMSAEQQTVEANWVEAYWYIWGQAQRINKQNAEKELESAAPDALPGSTTTEDVIHVSSANAARGTPRGRQNVADQFKIEDPDERRTKQQFERVLGKKMSDEEWYHLQNDDIRTMDEYEDLQESLKTRAG